ncbi:hypothetical protein APSETT445_000488 [Aspergillus pseudonomiae]
MFPAFSFAADTATSQGASAGGILMFIFQQTDLMFNVAPIGSPWPADSSLEVKRFLSASMGVELILLTLETVEKRRCLLRYQDVVSREGTSGPFSRLLFLWLNRLLKAGYGNMLTSDRVLPPVHEGLGSRMLSENFAVAWDNSSDIDSVAEFFRRTICDTWANALQLGLAIWLLADQIGAICIAPIIVTIKGSVSRHQKLWLEASQKRVDFTTKVLESIKSIKMLGLIEGMVHMIEELRTEEIEISKRFQKIQAAKASFGPMGCGKSMLLKTLLGEIEPVEGDIFISDPDIAYCDQSPWIFNSSIKENIIGESHFYDGEWYRSIINACCLDKDLRAFPAGHDTLIGSQGTRLSRGQMQRIAIARAVYARKPLAIFDDVLSGFDPVTERKVFDRVFSERGILQRIGCIVLLASRSVHNLSETDFVIALGADGFEMGTFRELRSARGYISKLDLSKGPQNSCEESIETDKTAMKRRTNRSGANIEDQNQEINDLANCKYYAAAIGWPRMALLLGILTMESLFGVLQYSFNGLVTIRSFGWTPSMSETTYYLLDTAQRPYYHLICIQRWLVLAINLIVAALVVLLMGLAITLELQVDPGLLGAGLLMMTMLGQSLSGLILRWTSTAPSLEAIARIKHFVEDTPKELKHSHAIDTEYDWPALGAIEFKDVCVRQESTFNLALRNITGKSSLTLALLGMVEVTSGQILIDSQDISTLPPSLVRKRINYLTREPFLIPASVRQNLDPLGDKCDGEIIIALERAKLWGVLVEISLTTNFPDCNPLDIIVDDSFLSYGQRQLLCLARILLKESTILLLDEPPSNLDPELDSEIQDILQSEFSSCTIIMIADKLQAILDFDYVAVIDEGQLVELGNPRTLLSEDQSTFRELYLAETCRSRKTRRVV